MSPLSNCLTLRLLQNSSFGGGGKRIILSEISFWHNSFIVGWGCRAKGALLFGALLSESIGMQQELCQGEEETEHWKSSPKSYCFRLTW